MLPTNQGSDKALEPFKKAISYKLIAFSICGVQILNYLSLLSGQLIANSYFPLAIL